MEKTITILHGAADSAMICKAKEARSRRGFCFYNFAGIVLAAAVSVNFNTEIGRIRPELHSSGFGPTICSCPQETIDDIKSMRFKAARTHDWALINPGQRVCDYFYMFPSFRRAARTGASSYERTTETAPRISCGSEEVERLKG